jgi:hypothetical protein
LKHGCLFGALASASSLAQRFPGYLAEILHDLLTAAQSAQMDLIVRQTHKK